MGKKKLIVPSCLLLFIISIYPVFATTIGVSPGMISFPKMIKAGYAEDSMVITSSTEETIEGHFEVEGEIEGWISFRPNSDTFSVSSQNPYRVAIIIIPPENINNGNYSGTIRVQTDTVLGVETGAGAAVIAAVAVKIDVEIIGDEIILCRAGAITVTDTEIGLPFDVSATVFNDGNVRLRPEVQINVYDPFTQESVSSSEFLGAYILPTLSKRINGEIQNDLDIGQYFIDIFVRQCGVTETLSFDVFEKGGIVDKGEFIGIRTNEITNIDEPVPVLPVFKNLGQRRVLAKFKGEIRSLKTGKIISVLESDELSVEPGEQIEFPLFFKPDKSGEYQVSGRIIYNKKITYEERSKVIKVVDENGDFKFSRWVGGVLLVILYLIIGLVILILIGKIKKEQNKKKKKF
ncbi:MAG: hypothetical protein KKF44_01350 [Nanoarchaeota archaeon]|nr:hypothetical protein [Nanoarchaeota archaeon]